MKKFNLDDMKQEMQLSFEGRDYILRCNLCVLDAVLEQCGGDLEAAFDVSAPSKSVMVWLAAMMNDYAEDQDWPDYVPYTAKQLGKRISPRNKELISNVMSLVTRSLVPIVEQDAEKTGD